MTSSLSPRERSPTSECEMAIAIDCTHRNGFGMPWTNGSSVMVLTVALSVASTVRKLSEGEGVGRPTMVSMARFWVMATGRRPPPTRALPLGAATLCLRRSSVDDSDDALMGDVGTAVVSLSAGRSLGRRGEWASAGRSLGRPGERASAGLMERVSAGLAGLDGAKPALGESVMGLVNPSTSRTT
jgi:hypothetical protein